MVRLAANSRNWPELTSCQDFHLTLCSSHLFLTRSECSRLWVAVIVVISILARIAFASSSSLSSLGLFGRTMPGGNPF